MKILVVDVGGAHVKIPATGQVESRKFSSGPSLTPPKMVSDARKLAKNWRYEAVSLG